MGKKTSKKSKQSKANKKQKQKQEQAQEAVEKTPVQESQPQPEIAIQEVEQIEQKSSSSPSFSLSHWRNIYIVFSIPLRFLFCLQASYIHPDEFFQAFQPLYNDNLPWEFSDPNSIARSIVPLYIFYRPFILIGTEWLQLKPLAVYYLVKLILCLLTWFVYDFCLFRIMPVKQERVKAMFFASSSFLTMVHQSHTFSNSIESYLVVLSIWIINDMREYLELNDEERKYTGRFSLFKLVLLGFVLALGVFNRVTFPVWFLLPGLFLIKFAFRYPFRVSFMISTFAITVLSFIYIDTVHFKGTFPIPIPTTMDEVKLLISQVQSELPTLQERLATLTKSEILEILLDLQSRLVVAPLNNFIYNTIISNLSKHGLHPYYTHLIVNYPQILGPLVLLLFPFSTKYTRTTPFLSAISGLIGLSLVPHQELRFLMPLMPLLACCIDVTQDWSPSLLRGKFKISVNWIIQTWVIFNLIMTFFYGILHQGGVIPAMEFIHDQVKSNDSANIVLLFWRTYKPPTWMLYDDMNPTNKSCIYLNNDEDDLTRLYYSKIDKTEDCIAIDFMGLHYFYVSTAAERLLKNEYHEKVVYLVAPFNAMLNTYADDSGVVKYEQVWSFDWHLDLDHFEFEEFGVQTLTPGLGVYKLQLV